MPSAHKQDHIMQYIDYSEYSRVFNFNKGYGLKKGSMCETSCRDEHPHRRKSHKLLASDVAKSAALLLGEPAQTFAVPRKHQFITQWRKHGASSIPKV
jgi:hypothetical protein